jgi:hypothetical protein
LKLWELKLLHRGPLERYYVHTKFHENLLSSSKVIIGGHTERQTGDLISLLLFLESRLKTEIIPIHLGKATINLSKPGAD